MTTMKCVLLVVLVIAVVAVVLLLIRRRSSQPHQPPSPVSEDESNRFYEAKQAALERILGPMDNIVSHAMIPFAVGGAVDMYYFPNAILGTGFATQELIEPDGHCPKPNRIGTYELVAFTKLSRLSPEQAADANKPFNKIERRICRIFTTLGNYSYDTVMNPGETAEIPGKEGEPTICIVFDQYKKDGVEFQIDGKKCCLLLCIEVHRSEMEFAMKKGSPALFAKLKQKGYYPYSDLDRDPVQ